MEGKQKHEINYQKQKELRNRLGKLFEKDAKVKMQNKNNGVPHKHQKVEKNMGLQSDLNKKNDNVHLKKSVTNNGRKKIIIPKKQKKLNSNNAKGNHNTMPKPIQRNPEKSDHMEVKKTGKQHMNGNCNVPKISKPLPKEVNNKHSNSTNKKKRNSSENMVTVPLKKHKKDDLCLYPESETALDSDDSSLYSESSIDTYGDESDYSDWNSWDEEEEDDYSSTDSNSTDNESSYYFDSDNESNGSADEDYRLPPDVPEDLIIHNGTATKRPLLPSDNIVFSNKTDSQIIELKEQMQVKIIEQPRAYDRMELIKLSESSYSTSALPLKHITKTVESENKSSENEDCPELVPITESTESQSLEEDDDDFQLYSEFDDSSLGSSYEECSDDDSIISVDVNSKYTHEFDDSSSDEYEFPTMNACIVQATNCTYTAPPENNDILDVAQELPVSPKFVIDEDTSDNVRIIESSVIEPLIRKPGLEPNIAQFTSPQQFVAKSRIVNTVTPTTDKSIRSIFYNAIDSNHVLVMLKDPIVIYGSVRLTLLAGSVQIYGYTPPINKELEIFSPRGCASVEITPFKSNNSNAEKKQLTESLSHLRSFFVQADLKYVESEFSVDSDALLLLRRNVERRKRITFISKHINENVFPKVNGSLHKDRRQNSSEYLLNCVINTANDKCLRIPKVWSKLQLTKQFYKLMIVGGKSVGKSTLLRYMINRNLEKSTDRVLLIDLDIGQPELFVPQTISCSILSGDNPILGPGFLQNHQPLKAYILGQTNVLHCIHDYVQAVQQLLNYCHNQTEFSEMPWIINTMGYNKGFGLELMSVIIQLLQPTDVVQIQSNRDINNFDAILEPHILPTIPHNIFPDFRMVNEKANKPQYKLHIIDSAIPQESRYQREWDMSAKDRRYVMILSRLSDALHGNAEWLSDGKPITASMESIKLVNMCSTKATANELQLAIETNLVYLCHYQDDDSQPLECLGIGVVRAVDHITQQIFLMPAMPLERMVDVNCLAIGEMPLPTSLFINQGPKVAGHAPFVYNTIDGCASRSIQQIYFRPAEFLTGGKHKTGLD